MRWFLKSLDEDIWSSVEDGWTAPTTSSTSETVMETTKKSRSAWTTAELTLCNNNSKALNAIFNGVTAEEFRRIATCETAREAWLILETTHEGTQTVKSSKLQMLTTRFETLRMEEQETFTEFYTKLSDIVNSCFNLGEKIPEVKVVWKVLRSLPERFYPKITTIEEAKDVNELKIDELVGSIQTFELKFPQPKKSKSVAFKTSRDEDGDPGLGSDEEMAVFARKFKKYLQFKKGKEIWRQGQSW